MKYKGKTYPKDLYVVRDSKKNIHWFDADPMKTPDRDAHEVEPVELLEEFYGGAGTVGNPIVVRIAGALLNRCEPFAISQPAAIRTGKLSRHLEDLDGRIVEIINAYNPNAEFPLNGVVMDREGRPVDYATYSVSGACSDGVESHSLVCVDGVFEGARINK